MKVVIVGGVAGGASAAARLRRLDENAEILIFERTGYISYANCGLPYYIGGTIEEEEALTLQTPAGFSSRFRIDVRVRHEVTAIFPSKKQVTVKALDTGEVFEESYDKLILAPGARPVRPPIPGIDNGRIFTLRTVEDTLRIRAFAEHVLSEKKIASAVVVGGGFIGVEMAENLTELGFAVTLVEKQPQVLDILDSDMASFVHAHLRKNRVSLCLGQAVASFAEENGHVGVTLEDGTLLSSDMVLLAAGVRPDSRLAEEAGLALGAQKSISVNDRMQTSDPDIYAVGDAVEILHRVSGKKALVSLAGPANKEGRIAADNIMGIPSRYVGSASSSILKVFSMTVASTGLSEKKALAAGYSCESLILSPASHATYYPGGQVMTLKVLFEPATEKILGAEIVGFDGVDKRIDVLATAMQAGLPVSTLKDLDLAYAPPYSSAKDPVNMAGFMAENILSGLVRQVPVTALSTLPRDGSIVLLDTRTDAEYARGHAEGFDTHIPLDSLRERLHELEPSKPVYVMCQSGLRSYLACRILSQRGYDCYNVAGGYRLYRSLREDGFDETCRTSCGLSDKIVK